MLRLSPAGESRLITASTAEMAFGGAECNVAIAASMMGTQSRYVTALPENVLADAAIMKVRSFGVDTQFMCRIPGRFGIYFVDPATGMQPASVIYDRAGSAVTTWNPTDSELDIILSGVTHFHFTGITVAIGGEASVTLMRLLTRCKGLGVHVSMDVNHRMKLWSVEAASIGLKPYISMVDTLICNENHARLLFNCSAESDVLKAHTLKNMFPNLDTVLVSRRRAISNSHDRWSIVAIDNANSEYFSNERDIQMIERVGGGDAFAGAYLSERLQGRAIDHSLNFGAAALALKHGVRGDFCTFMRQDVENVMVADSSMGVVR